MILLAIIENGRAVAVRVRRAEKRDIPVIVEVNCSDVERWYHFTPRGRAEPAMKS